MFDHTPYTLPPTHIRTSRVWLNVSQCSYGVPGSHTQHHVVTAVFTAATNSMYFMIVVQSFVI